MGSTTPAPSPAATSLTLDQVEALIASGHGRRPDELAFIRQCARVLRLMSGQVRGTYATLVCEPANGGLRVVEGGEALQVARELRARADRRGDHTWSMLMGRVVRFELVRRPPGRRSPRATNVATARS